MTSTLGFNSVRKVAGALIIEVRLCIDKEYISCPAKVGRNIKKLREEFLDWLYDSAIDHPYWLYRDGEKYGVHYRGDAFVYWLNHRRYHRTCAKMVILKPGDQVKKWIFF
ncbi:hypothetical protein GTO89_04660 [Heliobacterium gestii]|uniref:Uncharacterized protein n=1 Tax=Heliomicrobium gestii TaxID=2699 RepID=A0A845L6T9_HELGE|nr:hypothetical protein [Heliomicrobium gestii]MBM7866905.1 hypothetical protein [Heliomicrobium gestii]MZP42332.1 hypothetical protein [Heliomicrobium gestii]